MTIDFQRGAKVAGSKFYFTVGEDALRELKLVNHMVQYHTRNGYTFIIPPYLVREEVGVWAGQLPRFADDYYRTTDGHMLIPTAETALVGLHADEILNEADLPIRYVAFSPCFRREAGAAGTRDKGLKRVHQFHKVELFVICKPEDSERLHGEMLKEVTAMLNEMGFVDGESMRILDLPEYDRSPVSSRTWDIELLAGGEWLEVSSISNTLDNQSKLAKIRYRPKSGGKPIKCHLLNGSGVAIPRLTLALDQLQSDANVWKINK